MQTPFIVLASWVAAIYLCVFLSWGFVWWLVVRWGGVGWGGGMGRGGGPGRQRGKASKARKYQTQCMSCSYYSGGAAAPPPLFSRCPRHPSGPSVSRYYPGCIYGATTFVESYVFAM